MATRTGQTEHAHQTEQAEPDDLNGRAERPEPDDQYDQDDPTQPLDLADLNGQADQNGQAEPDASAEEVDQADWREPADLYGQADHAEPADDVDRSDWREPAELDRQVGRFEPAEEVDRSDWRDRNRQVDHVEPAEEVDRSDWRDRNRQVDHVERGEEVDRSDWREPADRNRRVEYFEPADDIDRSDWREPAERNGQVEQMHASKLAEHDEPTAAAGQANEPQHAAGRGVEVSTYLRRRGPRLLLLFIVVPLIAGVVAAVSVSRRPILYESTLRVTVPQELSSSASEVGLYLANLELRMSDPEVVDDISRSAGISADDYLEGLSLNRVGQSSSADFTFVSTDQDVAASVVEQVASAALRSMATAGEDFAMREVQLAEQNYQQALNKLNVFRAKRNVIYPQEQYRQAVAKIEAARAQVAESQAVWDSLGAARANASIQQMTKRMKALEKMLPRYQALDDARAVALELRSNALDRLSSKQAEIRLTDPENVRQDVTTRPLSQVRRTVQAGGAVAAAAIFLLFAVLVLPDLLRPRRSPR